MKKLYVFHGADRKVGVTMLVQSIAEYIAGAAPEANVLLLVLNGRQNVQYLKEEAPPIDVYRSRIESGVPVAREDVEAAGRLKNLYVISGVKKEAEERLYMPEMASRLLSDLRENFDLMIADTGSDLDNGLAVGGLSEAGKTYLLISQNEATLRRYEKCRELYDGLGVRFDGVIINKYLERDPYDLAYLRKRLGLTEAETYKVAMANAGRRAEMEYRTIMELEGGGAYSRDVGRIAQVLMEDAGISAGNEKRKSRWKNFI